MELTREEIMTLFVDRDAEEFASEYTAAQLREYYIILYGCTPYSGWRKIDIIRGIQKCKRGIDRALRMKP